MARTPVRLNVYDMYWGNEYISNIGFGIYHSGIEIYGIEYAFGGHIYSFSGIFENSPQDAEELGENFKFRESIHLGETDFTAPEVRELIKTLGSEFRGDRYHLISKNCNHFTAHLARTLTGREIPGWINRLATISSSIPFLDKMLPQEWLTPVALQQSLERKKSIDVAEEATESVVRTLNDSRTTVLENRTINGEVSGPSGAPLTSLPSLSNGNSSPSLSRLWSQLKSSVAGAETTIKF